MAKETIDAILEAEKTAGEAENSAKSAASRIISDAKERSAKIIAEKTEAAEKEAGRIISEAKADAERVMAEARQNTQGTDELEGAVGKLMDAAEKAVIERIIGSN